MNLNEQTLLLKDIIINTTQMICIKTGVKFNLIKYLTTLLANFKDPNYIGTLPDKVSISNGYEPIFEHRILHAGENYKLLELAICTLTPEYILIKDGQSLHVKTWPLVPLHFLIKEV